MKKFMQDAEILRNEAKVKLFVWVLVFFVEFIATVLALNISSFVLVWGVILAIGLELHVNRHDYRRSVEALVHHSIMAVLVLGVIAYCYPAFRFSVSWFILTALYLFRVVVQIIRYRHRLL